MIRKVANQTLKECPQCIAASSDGCEIVTGWRNPMVLVESIKVEKKIRKPYTDEERGADA